MDSILIIDDNRQVLEQLKELLSAEGYQVSFIPRGDFLFQRLETRKYDLLLLDINLPGKSGIEWLQDVKAHDQFKNIPVIMITGEDERSTLAKCFQLGASDYIHKPINEIALKARVQTAIAAKRFQEQQLKMEKQKALQAQMMMLTAQMNPHFIFNSLNSIQYFLLENDCQSALNYLSEFAGLMRKTLHNSSQSFISVSEEIMFLEKYLDLEKERFQERFDYVIINLLDDSDDILIPPMLLQPYLENAIVHGFKEIEHQGKIELKITESENTIEVIIKDNGIGREAAAKIRSAAPHRSVAISNTKTRLELLRIAYESGDFEVIINDLYNEGKASGTEIIICFSNDLH